MVGIVGYQKKTGKKREIDIEIEIQLNRGEESISWSILGFKRKLDKKNKRKIIKINKRGKIEVAGKRNRTEFFRRPVLFGYRFKPSASRQFYWAASGC